MHSIRFLYKRFILCGANTVKNRVRMVYFLHMSKRYFYIFLLYVIYKVRHIDELKVKFI